MVLPWEGLGPDVELTATTERMPSEQKWYALTGRVVDAKVEADGDIHLALQDADGKNAGTVSAERLRGMGNSSGDGVERRSVTTQGHACKKVPR